MPITRPAHSQPLPTIGTRVGRFHVGTSHHHALNKDAGYTTASASSMPALSNPSRLRRGVHIRPVRQQCAFLCRLVIGMQSYLPVGNIVCRLFACRHCRASWAAGRGHRRAQAGEAFHCPASARHRRHLGPFNERFGARSSLQPASRDNVSHIYAGRLASSAHTPATERSDPPARLKRRCASGDTRSFRAEAANTA